MGNNFGNGNTGKLHIILRCEVAESYYLRKSILRFSWLLEWLSPCCFTFWCRQNPIFFVEVVLAGGLNGFPVCHLIGNVTRFSFQFSNNVSSGMHNVPCT
jgi:hypothetical protein